MQANLVFTKIFFPMFQKHYLFCQTFTAKVFYHTVVLRYGYHLSICKARSISIMLECGPLQRGTYVLTYH